MIKKLKKEKRVDNFTVNIALKTTLSEINALDILIFYFRINKSLTHQEISDRLAISDECIRRRLQKIFVIAERNIIEVLKSK